MTFASFASSHGLIIDQAYPSERIRRCGTDSHPRSKNGAYWFDGDRGWIFVHDGEAKTIWWNDANVKPWSDAEKRQWEEKKRRGEQERENNYRRAAKTAQEIMRKCRPGEHNYLRGKQLPNVMGLVNDEKELFVPMRNVVNNDLVGGQIIKFMLNEREFSKKMIFGMRAKGAVFRLGSIKAAETWLVEGYATGLTVELALRRLSLNACVLICFSAANLVHVAPLIKGKKFVVADNDKSGTGEKAAKETGLPYCMPPVIGDDANDLYARDGLMALCKLISGVRSG